MSNSPVDRNLNFIRDMWSTDKLVTDCDATPPTRIIQEVVHDHAPLYYLKKQTELHEKIRNDEDYDDWSYGTEPTYGKKW